jgi:formate C-acetyltransferase
MAGIWKSGLWQKKIDVRDFIQQNYLPYEGDEAFLSPATARTKNLWNRLNQPLLDGRERQAVRCRRESAYLTSRTSLPFSL